MSARSTCAARLSSAASAANAGSAFGLVIGKPGLKRSREARVGLTGDRPGSGGAGPKEERERRSRPMGRAYAFGRRLELAIATG